MEKILVFLLLACLILASSMMGTASADECQHQFGVQDCTIERYCSACERWITTNTEHSWENWGIGDVSHTRGCTNHQCGAIDGNTHSGGIATCTNKAICDVCGGSYGEINSDAHDWGNWESDNDDLHARRCKLNNDHYELGQHSGIATCKERALCTVCNFLYLDKWNHSDYGTGEWLSMDENRHYRLCLGCNSNESVAAHFGGIATCTEKAVCDDCKTAYGKIDADNHNKVVLPAVAPTYTETGLTEGIKCDDCGEILVPQEVVPILVHLPQTGDNSNVVLWFALACISLFGMTMLVRKRKEA